MMYTLAELANMQPNANGRVYGLPAISSAVKAWKAKSGFNDSLHIKLRKAGLQINFGKKVKLIQPHEVELVRIDA